MDREPERAPKKDKTKPKEKPDKEPVKEKAAKEEPVSCCTEKQIWAATRQNLQNGMFAQRRLRSAFSPAQSDRSLRCALNG